MLSKLHHIGYAVSDISHSAKAFSVLGYHPISEQIYDAQRKVNILFMQNEALSVVELVAPAAIGNPVDGILEKTGTSPYHLCFEVSDINSAIKQLKEEKYVPMGIPSPACAIDNKKVIFLYNKNVGLIELVEV